MKKKELDTQEPITWCPGCPNFVILDSAKRALAELVTEKKIKAKNIAMASGIGCHAKIFDYIDINGFYGLHGRVLPLCLGMKAANPELTVLGFGGDGDTYAEGISHFVHNCRYNADMTMIVHNNKVFALTTGQATPTSEPGFVSKSTPLGVKEPPLNPIALALSAGATFVARGYTKDPQQLTKIIKKAVQHKGFAVVDVLQPCLTFHDFTSYLEDRTYELDKGYPASDLKKALNKALEWNYSAEEDAKVALGIFYQKEKPTLQEHWPQLKKPWYRVKRKIKKEELLAEFK